MINDSDLHAADLAQRQAATIEAKARAVATLTGTDRFTPESIVEAVDAADLQKLQAV